MISRHLLSVRMNERPSHGVNMTKDATLYQYSGRCQAIYVLYLDRTRLIGTDLHACSISITWSMQCAELLSTFINLLLPTTRKVTVLKIQITLKYRRQNVTLTFV